MFWHFGNEENFQFITVYEQRILTVKKIFFIIKVTSLINEVFTKERKRGFL